jgi:hypothetical protein
MGIETGPVAGAAAYSHAGSTGSYRAWLGFFPHERLSVALLCNSGAVNTEDLGERVAARFLPAGEAHRGATIMAMTAPIELAGLYRNSSNDSAVEAKIDASGLHLNGGPGFGLVGKERLSTADAKRAATVLRSRSGAVKGLTVTRTGNSPVVLERVALWKPTAEDLRRLAGDYSSIEVDGTHRIELAGADLAWRDPSGLLRRLVPIYKDAFEAPDASWTLRFRRETRGTTVLDMSITRARHIAFRRI